MKTYNILYLFDDKADLNVFSGHVSSGQNIKLLLCPHTTNHDFIDNCKRSLSKRGFGIVDTADFPRLFNNKAFSIREDYIKLIADIPDKITLRGVRLKSFFKHPFHAFSLWWFSLIAEKNTLKSKSYHQLSKFLAFRDIIDQHQCGEVYVDIEDDILADTIKSYVDSKGIIYSCAKEPRKSRKSFPVTNVWINSLLRFLFLIIRIFYVKRIMPGLNYRHSLLRQSKYLFLTFFPIIDKTRVKKGEFINLYYAPLQRALHKSDRERVTWLAMRVSVEGFTWRGSVKLGRRVNDFGKNLYFYEEWLRLKDIIVVLTLYFYFAIKFALVRPYIINRFKWGEDNLEIWSLFKNEWDYSFFGWNLLETLIYYYSFRNIIGELQSNAKIIYLDENQAWSKALNLAVKGKANGRVMTIGIQHTSIPLLYLQFFNSQRELREMPKPDYLLCSGRIPCNLLAEKGISNERIRVWGALRFQGFRKYVSYEIPWKGRKNKVVVALTINFEESKEVLRYVWESFRDGVDYEVVIKGHYACPVSSITKALDIDIGNSFSVVETPLSKLLPEAKGLIVTGSTAALEAIACQCPVIIPGLIGVVDMNPLSGVSDLPIYVDSPRDLRKTVDEIVYGQKSPISYERCKELIQNYFEFLDSDDEFLRRIEAL